MDYQHTEPRTEHVGVFESPVTQAIFEVLDRYFAALQNGEGDQLHASLAFDWPDEKVARLVAGIDAEFVEEITRNASYWNYYTAGPELARLPIEAQRALAEEVAAIVIADREQQEAQQVAYMVRLDAGLE